MRKATLAVLLVCACFGESSPIGGGDAGEGTSGSGDGSSGASASDTSVGSTNGTGTSTSAGTTASTTSTSDGSDSVDDGSESGPPACGMLGGDCCEDGCDEGACHRGRCVVFAGGYAEPMTCGGCTELPNGPNNEVPPSMIPFLGACECPVDFAVTPELPVTSDYCPQEGVLHTPTALRFCQAPTLHPGSDWFGTYVTSVSSGCASGRANGCVVPNAYTGGCTCPDGATEMIAQTWAPCSDVGTADDPIAVHICVPTATPPISFGGAYQTRWSAQGNPVCEAGNPRMDGSCECPAGFAPESLRITSPIIDQGGDLMLCVGY